jgi:hypothetical protein
MHSSDASNTRPQKIAIVVSGLSPAEVEAEAEAEAEVEAEAEENARDTALVTADIIASKSRPKGGASLALVAQTARGPCEPGHSTEQ